MDQQKMGAFLKKLRNERNLTQEQLAERFGVSRRSVSRWEVGYNLPDIDVLMEMSEFYDVELRQHRIMGQGDSAEDFHPSESMENAGILDVFPIFNTARSGQKIH